MNFFKFILKRARFHWYLIFTLLIGVIFATALLASGPLIIDTILNFTIPYKLNTSEPLDGNIRLTAYENFSRDEYDEFDNLIQTRLEKRLGEYISAVVTTGNSASVYPWIGEYLVDDQRVSLYFYEGLKENTYLVEGDWPDKADVTGEEIRVVIGETISNDYNLKVGDQLPLSFSVNESEPSLWFIITGIISPNDIQDIFWFGEFNPLLNQSSERWSAQYSAFINEEDFFHLNRQYFASSRPALHWNVLLDHPRINAGNINTFITGLNNFRYDLKDSIPKINIATNIGNIISALVSRTGIVRIVLYLLIAEVLFLAIYYIAVISTLLAEYLGGEFSNLSSRGSTFNKLIFIQFTESLIIGGIAFLIGILLALVIVWAIAEIGPISDVKNLDWKIQFTDTSLIAAGLGIVVCVISLLFPVRKALKRSIVVHTRVSGREERSPFWQRYYLDVLLLLIGLIMLWRFYFYGGLSEADRLGSVDWLVLLSPFVLLVGAATILYRIFPPVMRGLSKIFASGKDFVTTLALFHLARNPANVSRIMLLLILTMSLGILTSGLNATLDASEYERALYSVGSLVRFEYNQFVEDFDLTEISSVVETSAVYRSNGSVNIRAYRVIPSYELLAIDPFSFVKVTKYRVDYASKPMGQVMRNLVFDIRDFEFPTIELPGTPNTIGVWVFDDTLSYEENNLLESMTIRGKILTAGGDVFIVNLQFQPPVDDINESVSLDNNQSENNWYYFEGSIPALSEDKYPLSLHSIWFNYRSTDFQYWQISLLIDDILLKYPNNDQLIIDDFENIERIWQANDIQANVNFTRQRSSHSGNGSLNIKLPFDRTIIRGVGIFPGGRITKSPIPVLASEEFLNSSEMEIGDTFFGAVNSLQIQMVIAESVRYFPTLYDQPGKGFLVVPLDPLLIYLNQETVSATNSNELWINSNDKNLISMIESEIPNSVRVQTLNEVRKSIKADPLSLGLRSVTMISYLIALFLSVIGFSSYTFLSSKSREVHFGVLRSLGMSIKQLYGMLFIEQAFLIIAGLTIGLILGLVINLIVLPGLPISLSEQPPIPPFLPHMNWGSILTLYAAMIAVFILVLGISALLLWRARIHEVLRIGME